MYKEIEKYKTGGIVKGSGVIVNMDNRKIEIDLDEYDFPLGDLIMDFHKHMSKPRWRRKYYHKNLTKIYKDALNYITLTHGV